MTIKKQWNCHHKRQPGVNFLLIFWNKTKTETLSITSSNNINEDIIWKKILYRHELLF